MKKISMEMAIERAGGKPEWGYMVCCGVDGKWMWLNVDRVGVDDNDTCWAPASFGNTHPQYFEISSDISDETLLAMDIINITDEPPRIIDINTEGLKVEGFLTWEQIMMMGDLYNKDQFDKLGS